MARTKSVEPSEDVNNIVEISDETDTLSLDKMAVDAIAKPGKAIELDDEEVKIKTSKPKNVIEKPKKTAYFNYSSRLTIKLLLFGIFFVLGIYFLVNSVSLQNEKIIKYSETSNLGYSVCLKENEFYEEDCLDNTMFENDPSFVASLINTVNLKFDYAFRVEKPESIRFTYDVIGKVLILDKMGEKEFYEKEYPIETDKTVVMTNSDNQILQAEVKIDYDEYNEIANQFKSLYGIDSQSKLIVYMNINKTSTYEPYKPVGTNSILNVSIPLSESAVDIKLDYNDINTSSSIVDKQNVIIENYYYLVPSIVCVILAIIFMLRVIRQVSAVKVKKSAYDKYINKILKEYDRLIAESSTLASFDDKEIIELEKFSELLDIHDNLGLPIMYYNFNDHVKSYFYILHEDIVYIHVVKSSDMEAKKRGK